jgi:cyclase
VAVEKKLHELGNGIYAYTQLPGSWGWSNAGLITDGDQSLLVDTLFAGMARKQKAGR